MDSSTTQVSARIGMPGSYSDMAAKKFFAPSKILVCKSIHLCFMAVLEGKASGALVPVRNAIVGDIKYDDMSVGDMADEMGMSAVSSHKLKMSLVLASYGKLRDVKIAYSTQPALDQCTKFSKAHPDIAMLNTFNDKKIPDTTAAAEIVKNMGVAYAAAICSADGATRHGIPAILDPVADQKGNFTTFFLYEKKSPGRPGATKLESD